jgi:GNAT superfamily N-acetyltransferase
MTPAELFELVDATWPAAARHRVDPWLLREGRGGGQRVSAITALGPVTAGDIEGAIDATLALGQSAVFMIRPEDAALDAQLNAMGWCRHDPVVAYAAPCHLLSDPAPDAMSAFPHWPPLAIARDIWRDGGVGPARLAVMERAQDPKCAILGRVEDRAAGIAFVATAGRHAMLHALEVAPALRRRGVAQALLRSAAGWAARHGAVELALVVTEANTNARALYTGLGMIESGRYHYRISPT